MKLLLIIIISFVLCTLAGTVNTNVLLAQEKENYWKVDKKDPFNDVNVPFLDGLSMWIIRQKLTLGGYQALIKADSPTETGITSPQSNTRIDLYLPLVYNEEFSSMVGVQHYTTRIQTDVKNMDMGLVHEWFWFIVSYQVQNWKFLLSTEYFMNTNRNSFLEKKGDILMPLLTTGYAFSNSWQLMCLTGFRKTTLADEEKNMPVIGIQARYQPDNTFKLIFGAPVILASEWAVSNKLHLGCKALFTGVFSGEAFATFYPNEHYYLGLHYQVSENASGSSYFRDEIYQNGTEQIVYNNLTQNCHAISLDIGIKLSEDVAAILTGGYRIGGKVKLNNNDNHRIDIDGKNELFVGVAVQYLKYFD